MDVNRCTKPLGLIVLAGALVLTGDVATAQANITPGKACHKSAVAQRKAASRAAWADFYNELAVCLNTTPFSEALKCAKKAEKALKNRNELVQDQFLARTQVCQQVGQDPYHPDIDSLDFTSVVDNPYFTLIPGNTLVYEGDTEDGLMRIENTTLAETHLVMDVECAVVHSIESLDGVILRDSFYYYAQHEDGTVWYFGKRTFAMEDDVIVSINGTWIAEEDGARPGIVMLPAADIGLFYRQSFAPNVEEGVGKFQATGQSVSVPYNNLTYLDCWQIRNTTALDPDALEQRFYAEGVGLVRMVDANTGDQIDLVDIVVE